VLNILANYHEKLTVAVEVSSGDQVGWTGVLYFQLWHKNDLPHVLSLGPFTAALPTLDAERRLSGGNET
jgi:hypothetical protein